MRCVKHFCLYLYPSGLRSYFARSNGWEINREQMTERNSRNFPSQFSIGPCSKLSLQPVRPATVVNQRYYTYNTKRQTKHIKCNGAWLTKVRGTMF